LVTDVAVAPAALRGAGIGFVVGTALVFGKMYQLEFKDDPIRDRSYRLYYNKNQSDLDAFTWSGAVIGALAFRRGAGGVLQGSALGLICGTIVGMAKGLLVKHTQ